MKTSYKLSSYFSFVFAVSASLISCQKVIDIDLKSTEPRIVIQGSITDQEGSYSVEIHKTVNFNEVNDFPPVSGALVVISDDLENSEILTETSPGIYTGSSLQGVPGRTYTLSVKVNDQEYKAVSTMPLPVEITDLKIRQSDFGPDKVVDVTFNDILDVDNYYRIIQIINGSQQPEIDIYDDEFNNGTEINYTLFTDREDVDLQKGDSIVVLLRSIDEPTFEFYRTAREALGSSQSPANPNSNLSNGALGYFSAFAVRQDTVIVE